MFGYVTMTAAGAALLFGGHPVVGWVFLAGAGTFLAFRGDADDGADEDE